MPHLEPTYLRYIYDGLIKGSIHPENAAELPDGLIGMYEEAFDERTSVVERQKLLQRFAIWALLKKEVSAAFVAEVLGETEDDIQEFISTYSAWFNSPESGKYQLYHERLKVYLLQKLSEGEIHMLHDKLITRLESAIEDQKADEFEWYGLEFLAGHLGVSAMLNGDGKKLIELAYSQTYWQRQLKISKGYTWTKNGLKEVMTWASKYNDDEVIECGLQMVDLHHHEQNAAPQIVALVAEGDFDSALKRIEQFSGNDKEGLQRKFILYMLCLMELTLLESRNKPFRKEGIERLLKHLDEQLPVDHSVLNWGEFFSGHLIFRMACNAYNLGVRFDLIFQRVAFFYSMDEKHFDWINSSNSYTKDELIVMGEMIERIAHYEKNDLINLWLVELAKHNQFKLINSVLRKVDSELKDEYLDLIASTLASRKKIEKSIHYALKINDANDKNLTLLRITNILLESNQYVEAKEVLPHLTIRYYRVVSLCLFSNYLFKSKTGNHLNALNQAIKISETIQNDSWLIMAKRRISATLITQRKFSKAFGIIGESFKIQTKREVINDFYLLELLQLLVEFRKFQFLKSLIDQIQNRSKKNLIIKNISLKLIESNKLELSSEIFQIINLDEEEYPGMFRWDIVLNLGSIELAKKGKINLALDLVGQIKSSSDHCDALIGIAQILFKNNKRTSGLQIIGKTIEKMSSTGNAYDKGEVLKKIIILLLKHDLYENAIKVFQLITDDFWSFKDEAKIELAKYFIKNELYDQSLIYISKVSAIENKLKIPLHFTNQPNIELSKIASIFFQCIIKSDESFDSKNRDKIKSEIVSDYLKMGYLDQAQTIASFIESNTIKCESLIEISSNNLCASGNIFDDIFIKALNVAKSIDEEYEKCVTLSKLSALQLKLGFIEKADSILNEAILLIKELMEPWNFMALDTLSPMFFEIGKKKFIVDYIISTIEESFVDFGAKKDLIIQLAKFGHLEDSRILLNDLEIQLEKIEGIIAIANELIVKREISEANQIIEDALELTRTMNVEDDKCTALGIISTFYFNRGKKLKADVIIKEGMEFAQELKSKPDIFSKSVSPLAIELANQRKYEEAILFAKEILYTKLKDQTLKSICNICFKYEEWEIAQEASAEIIQNEIKFLLWQNIGEKSIKEKGLRESILCINKISDEISRTSYLKGIINSIKVVECSKEILKSIICYYIKDISSIETLLYKCSLNELFFQKNNFGKHQNISPKVESIQWAIDIKNQMN